VQKKSAKRGERGELSVGEKSWRFQRQEGPGVGNAVGVHLPRIWMDVKQKELLEDRKNMKTKGRQNRSVVETHGLRGKEGRNGDTVSNLGLKITASVTICQVRN